MKKIINGKKYDTETAHEVGSWDNGLYSSDFGMMAETLYRKLTGEYFIYGYGGPATRYAEAEGNGSYGYGESIEPLTVDAAMSWAEERLGTDEYESEFGEVGEGDGDVAVSFRISEAARTILKREASRTGRTQSSIVDGLIRTLGRES